MNEDPKRTEEKQYDPDDVLKETRRAKLIEVDAIERHLGIEPRTAELRKLAKQGKQDSK